MCGRFGLFAELDARAETSRSLSTAGGPASGKPKFPLPRFRSFNGDVWNRMALGAAPMLCESRAKLPPPTPVSNSWAWSTVAFRILGLSLVIFPYQGVKNYRILN